MRPTAHLYGLDGLRLDRSRMIPLRSLALAERTWIATAIAFFGVAILEIGGGHSDGMGGGITIGDGASLLSAALFSVRLLDSSSKCNCDPVETKSLFSAASCRMCRLAA